VGRWRLVGVSAFVDPPRSRSAPICVWHPCCDGGRADLHIVCDERGAVTIEWRKGADRVVDVRCCLRCGMPLRIEQVAAEK